MSSRRTWLLIAASALIMAAACLLTRGQSETLVAGKAVAHWLDTLSHENTDCLLHPGHLLAEAGVGNPKR
jgi:hypothetical protein